jgi:threonylcarbamoyladenosine tRNA methylthiotransferase MtaB
MTVKTFKIVTLGCKTNQFESASLKASLLDSDWSEASKDEEADVIVVNTCIVTKTASSQSRQAINKAIRETPSCVVAAVGCYAQAFPEELTRISGVNLIAGNTVKDRLPGILKQEISPDRQCVISEEFGAERAFEELPLKGFPDRTRAFLKIQDGCQSFCSYCIVPFARGPLRSLKPSQALSMLEALLIEGHKEVVLTGIHLGKYGVDLKDGVTLEGLLHMIKREGFPLRIRLSSLEPKEIGEGLIEMMAAENWLCRHLHIPLQSGDNGILKGMNRHYTTQEFSNLVERIHRRIPLAAIGADVMAGFPGEDLQAFQNTLSLIQDLPISYLHVFPFSPRKGTKAAGFSGHVDQGTIKERAAQLRSLGQRKRETFYRSCLGKEFLSLAEGWESEEKKLMKGMTDNYLPAVFPSSQDLKNQLVPVVMKSFEKGKVVGRITNCSQLQHGL